MTKRTVKIIAHNKLALDSCSFLCGNSSSENGCFELTCVNGNEYPMPIPIGTAKIQTVVANVCYVLLLTLYELTSADWNHCGTMRGISLTNRGKLSAPRMLERTAIPKADVPVVQSLSQSPIIDRIVPTIRTTRVPNF